MICLTVRPLFTTLFLSAALGAAIPPASAQLTPLTPNGTASPNSTQPVAPRPGVVAVTHSYGFPVGGNGGQGRFYPQPAPRSPSSSGTTGFGYAGGVPLSPGFGGNVAPQPGFGYQPGVILGPGFGAQTLQPIITNGPQPQRYGNDGLPVLPNLPGYPQPGNSQGGYYNNGQTSTNYPTPLGGYYFSNYSSEAAGSYTLPTVYSLYNSFPGYFYLGGNVGVTVLPTPPTESYDSGYLPYEQPSYQVNNQYNYTVNNYYADPGGDGGNQVETPRIGAVAPAALTGYDAAFADIKNAWLAGNIDLLKKHLRDNDVKIAVSLRGKYSYSIASGDFATITKDAFDKLTTSSFGFTSIRKADNGDVTGYARHVYVSSAGTDGTKRTIYLSFTLSKVKDQWVITSIDSSTEKMDDPNTGSAGTRDQSLTVPGLTRSASAGG